MNLLDRRNPVFPPLDRALDDPNGLLAVGGELTEQWLVSAYRRGIFPWFDDDAGPILWWSPDPRAVIYPDQLKVSRSLAKRLRNGGFEVTYDTAFPKVIAACSEPRKGFEGRESGTWITPKMASAYCHLHDIGLAHSIEVWLTSEDGARRLAGGLYGVSLGRMFFGESMFAREPDASKVALYHLCQRAKEWSFTLIDCQVGNPHLERMGAVEIPRRIFAHLIEENADQPTYRGRWTTSQMPTLEVDSQVAMTKMGPR